MQFCEIINPAEMAYIYSTGNILCGQAVKAETRSS